PASVCASSSESLPHCCWSAGSFLWQISSAASEHIPGPFWEGRSQGLVLGLAGYSSSANLGSWKRCPSCSAWGLPLAGEGRVPSPAAPTRWWPCSTPSPGSTPSFLSSRPP
ncbi:ST5 isoform 57, partial [Pan troglodytes]